MPVTRLRLIIVEADNWNLIACQSYSSLQICLLLVIWLYIADYCGDAASVMMNVIDDIAQVMTIAKNDPAMYLPSLPDHGDYPILVFVAHEYVDGKRELMFAVPS